MKNNKTKLSLAGIALLAAGYAIRVFATTYLVIGSLSTVNNTTSNLTSFAVGSFSVPQGTYYIQHAALIATNDARVDVQVSLNNVNFSTVWTWYSGSTADTTTNAESFRPAYTNIPIYVRAVVTTTNSVQIGATAQF